MTDERPPEIDFTIAHQARVYDYLLGGKDNYAADREAAERAVDDYPGGTDGARALVRANRAFLGRAVHHLAAEAGLRQFLDIGTGIPTANNTHEVAQRAAPESRIVYVDNDPIVLAHAEALLTSTPEGITDYVDADLRDPETILRKAAATLDFSRPIAVMLVAILHIIEDHDDPYGIVARLMEAVPSGSHLVIVHGASDILPEAMDSAARNLNQRMRGILSFRGHDEVARFFDGLELLEPGLVPVHRWRPGVGVSGTREIPLHCGVARKP